MDESVFASFDVAQRIKEHFFRFKLKHMPLTLVMDILVNLHVTVSSSEITKLFSVSKNVFGKVSIYGDCIEWFEREVVFCTKFLRMY